MGLGLLRDAVWPAHGDKPDRTANNVSVCACDTRRQLSKLRLGRTMRLSHPGTPELGLLQCRVPLCEGAIVFAVLPFTARRRTWSKQISPPIERPPMPAGDE